jgi:hypothetical protein
MGVVLYGTEKQDGASLGALSVLMKGESLPAGTRWHGTPCEPLVTKPGRGAASDIDVLLSTTPASFRPRLPLIVHEGKNAPRLPLSA